MSLTQVASLDQLAADPGRAQDLPPEVARGLLPRVIGLQTALLARALSAPGGNGPQAPAQDRPAQPPVSAEAPDWGSRAGRKSMPDPHLYVARSSLLSVKEAAKMLSCSEAAVRKWVYRRQLPAVKLGGRLIRLRLTDVEALIARGSRPARADRP